MKQTQAERQQDLNSAKATEAKWLWASALGAITYIVLMVVVWP